MQPTPVNFSQVLGDLQSIDRWLSDRGIAGRNRIRIYESNIEAMLKIHEQADPAQVYSDLAAKGRLTEILSSYVEGIGFVSSITALRDLDIDIPASVLESALRGPADAAVEDERSNQGRNFAFELDVAAMVARAGLTPDLQKEADVTFEFEGRRVAIECKRILSEKKIQQRIREAADRLKKNVKDNGDFGLIAVCVTRTINPGNVIWSVPSVCDMGPLLSSHINEVIGRLDPFLQRLRHPALSGVIFYVASPISVRGIGFSPVKRATVYPLSGLKDEELLRRLGKMIKV